MKTIGAVSFLNALPLVDGLDREAGLSVVRDVPSRLLAMLLDGRADVALCPTFDFQAAPRRLRIVPAGGIGSSNRTLTVRIFSPLPLERVRTIRVDPDSHTSVALAQVVFADLVGVRPAIEPLPGEAVDADEALLLIGDKVVTTEPARARYPYQLDLGEAWHAITGLPFVFAVWMTCHGTRLGDLPAVLERTLEANLGRLDEIAARHGPERGWPAGLACHYLENLLSYRIGPQELESMQVFWTRCRALGLIEELRPLAAHE